MLADLAERAPAGTTCGVTSCKVSAMAGGHGTTEAAAAAAMASCADLLLQTTILTSCELLPLLLAVSPLYTANTLPACLGCLGCSLSLRPMRTVLTWTRDFILSESLQQHLVAEERCTGMKATQGRPMHVDVDKSEYIGWQPARDQDVGIQLIPITPVTDLRSSCVYLYRCELTRL